ncbi:sulfotransferase [Roseobacter sp.]|uniref:sulfotransferase n=1 Tax=Roseobacter sp. TaxID=1907202 RepID=UPI00385FBA20
MKRFMIVSKQRSGTNHFVSLLKSHPQIACFGEVFRDGYNVPELIGEAFAHYAPTEARKTDPDRFLDDLEEFVKTDAYVKFAAHLKDGSFLDPAAYQHYASYVNSDIDVLGFKVFPKQFLPVTQVAHRAGLQIIRLVRTNLLAIYSSSQIAKLTGQGTALVHQEVQRSKLDFDAKHFERFITALNAKDDDVNKALQIIPEDRIFEMEYSDLGSERVLENLLNFLGVEPRQMTSLTQKRNPSRIVDRFNNPGTVMAYLEQHQLTTWAEE